MTEIPTALAGALLGGALVFAAAHLRAERAADRAAPDRRRCPDERGRRAAAVPRQITDDKRLMRNYPEQPPVIPHSIDNYQLT